mgnify:FL=1
MITTAKILSFDGRRLLLEPETSIERELLKKQIGLVEIRLPDGREISNEQRKKVFAIIRDISLWSGHEPEYLRQYLTWDFISRNNIDMFSLSNVDMTTAKEFINYLIDFCFYHSIPTKDALLTQTDDIGKYLYLCLEHRKCAICNQAAEVHHVNRIGMGRDREKIVHVGLKAISLCGKHHDMAHRDEQALFTKYCIYGITLDEYLCTRLTLNTKQRG